MHYFAVHVWCYAQVNQVSSLIQRWQTVFCLSFSSGLYYWLRSLNFNWVAMRDELINCVDTWLHSWLEWVDRKSWWLSPCIARQWVIGCSGKLERTSSWLHICLSFAFPGVKMNSYYLSVINKQRKVESYYYDLLSLCKIFTVIYLKRILFLECRVL